MIVYNTIVFYKILVMYINIHFSIEMYHIKVLIRVRKSAHAAHNT